MSDDLFGYLDPRQAPAEPSPAAGDVVRTADFSECRRWRYRLTLDWDAALPLMAVCMLNPSTADEFRNDPTIERMERRARAGGYGALVIVNLYAARSTDPRALYKGRDPIGAGNDAWISGAARDVRLRGGVFICGWGTHGDKVQPGRAAHVVALIAAEGVAPHAITVNGDGSPGHPLYVSYDKGPVPYTARKGTDLPGATTGGLTSGPGSVGSARPGPDDNAT